ncbi:MAG TPA: DUF4097 family beta strand repeat-containing protein [Thermoleophilaceae bacterium]|nr:DUF4097 family beta strand repeat-containing protein [Thermoleophilaceae bacterium]
MRKTLIVIAIAVGALAVLGCAAYAVAQVFEETDNKAHTVSRSIDHIVIEVESGDIDLVPGGRSVRIDETDDYVFDSPDVSRTVSDGVLTIESECDGVMSVFCTTDFRVGVPRGVTVDVRSYVGDIDIDRIDARAIEARAHVGDVHVDALRKGEIDARTNVGDVEVELPKRIYDRAYQAVDARTDVGDADVTPR